MKLAQAAMIMSSGFCFAIGRSKLDLPKWLPRVDSHQDRQKTARPQLRLVASPGFAPGPSGSEPGMLLLHHEAVRKS